MRIVFLTVAATLGLAACTNTLPQTDLNPGFGDSYYQNIAV